jgi:hypothetical protein
MNKLRIICLSIKFDLIYDFFIIFLVLILVLILILLLIFLKSLSFIYFDSIILNQKTKMATQECFIRGKHILRLFILTSNFSILNGTT